MLRGFTTAAACFVFSTQIQHVFGVYERPKTNMPFFKLLQPYVHLYKNALLVNWTAVIISVISIIFLLTTKILINDKFKKQFRNIPIPSELLVVFDHLFFLNINKLKLIACVKIIAGTTVSYAFDLNENHNLAVVGKIPTG